jgi:hypothetical protein
MHHAHTLDTKKVRDAVAGCPYIAAWVARDSGM